MGSPAFTVIHFHILYIVYWIKDNYEVIRQFNLFPLAHGMEHIADRLWLADGMWQKMCDWVTHSLTELEMVVNAWVAFATKNYFLKPLFYKLNVHLHHCTTALYWLTLPLNDIFYWLININSSIFRFGRLHFNSLGLCPIVMLSIIEFWQIDDLLLGMKI